MMITETINSRLEKRRDTLEHFMRLKDSPGVYIIECLANGACYAGATTSLRKRAQGHFSKLNAGSHDVPLLQGDWKKYGSEQFVFWFCYAPMASLHDLEKQVTLLTNGLEDYGGYNKALLAKRWGCARICDSEAKLRRRGKFIPIRSALDRERINADYVRTFCQANRPLSAEADMQIQLDEKQRSERLRQLMGGFQRASSASLLPKRRANQKERSTAVFD